MARTGIWAALAVAAGLVVGCGPTKEVPDALPSDNAPGDQQPVVPAASDPAAKAVFDSAVKAYTGGKPELLSLGKVTRVTAKGVIQLPVGNQKLPVETVRRLQAVWPDRMHVAYELKGEFNKTKAIWLLRPSIAVVDGDAAVELPNPTEFERVVAIDVIGQHWLPLLLPATHPKLVVFDLQKTAIGGKPVNVIKLALPDMPVYQATFDAKTEALVRVDYANTEAGLRVRNALALSDHKVVEGLLLPGKIEYARNGELVEQWAVEGWEFPDKIDDQEFTPPKK